MRHGSAPGAMRVAQFIVVLTRAVPRKPCLPERALLAAAQGVEFLEYIM